MLPTGLISPGGNGSCSKVLLRVSSLVDLEPLMKPGWLSACMASGRVAGDYLELTPNTYARLLEAYGQGSRCPSCGG
jgi:hypothetical protein